MITVIKDIDAFDDIEKYDVILVGTNINQAMYDGFQMRVKNKYPFVMDLNLRTKYGDRNKLGTRATTKNTKPIFSLCFILQNTAKNKETLNYSALENCIKTANKEFAGLNVATSFIGTSNFDGNGDKDKVMEILKNNSSDINLFVYDYKQKSRSEIRTTHLKNMRLIEDREEKIKYYVDNLIDNNLPNKNEVHVVKRSKRSLRRDNREKLL